MTNVAGTSSQTLPATIDLVARAKALAPDLTLRAREAEVARRVSDATIAQIKEAGLFRMLMPRRVGGYELPLDAFAAVVTEIGKGCGSTAWVTGVINAHHWVMGLFPPDVQDEVFLTPDSLVAAVPAPRGQAQPTEGGYLLNGRWPFCSGCLHASWVVLGAEIKPEPSSDSMPVGLFAVPVADIEILDDWRVSGLCATGSNSVVVKSAFIPAHRVISLVDATKGERPHLSPDSNSLFRTPLLATLGLGLIAPALGIATGALDSFVSNLPKRKLAYTDLSQAEHGVTHERLGEAAMKVHAAGLLVREHARATEAATDGPAVTFKERARIRMMAAHTVRLCLEAVDLMFSVGGGASIADSSPLQRASRDLHAASAHGYLMFEIGAEIYGRTLLNLPVEHTAPIV